MATVSNGPIWADHSQNGTSFSLRHVLPTFIDYKISAVPASKKKPGRAEMTVKLRLSYSHHCFSAGLDKVPTAPADHYYTCSTRGETRVFCVDRWKESFALPGYFLTNTNCYFSRHHNYFIVRDPSNLALGEYFVYFTVSYRDAGYVDVFIESAYPRLDGHRQSRAKKVSLNVLVVNALRNVPTHRS